MLEKLTGKMNINLTGNTMKKINKNYLLPILAICFLSSCGDISKEAEKRLNDLNNKAESLDSLINKEVDKVLTLDSLVNRESDKVKRLDSLINEKSSQIDSISKKGSELLEKFSN